MNRRRVLLIDGLKVVATGLFLGVFLRAESLGEALVLFGLSVLAFAGAFVLTPNEPETK